MKNEKLKEDFMAMDLMEENDTIVGFFQSSHYQTAFGRRGWIQGAICFYGEQNYLSKGFRYY